MPQATDELRKSWRSDEDAFKQFGDNFIVTTDGMIISKQGYKQTGLDFSAIEYLFQEWDYGYEDRDNTYGK